MSALLSLKKALEALETAIEVHLESGLGKRLSLDSSLKEMIECHLTLILVYDRNLKSKEPRHLTPILYCLQEVLKGIREYLPESQDLEERADLERLWDCIDVFVQDVDRKFGETSKRF